MCDEVQECAMKCDDLFFGAGMCDDV